MLNNLLTFANSNINPANNFPQQNHQQHYTNQLMQQQQQQKDAANSFVAYSIESNNNSVNSNSASFLTAANTIVFNPSVSGGGGGGGGSTSEDYSYNGYANNSLSSNNSSFVKLYNQPGVHYSSPSFGSVGGASRPPNSFTNESNNQQQHQQNSPSLAKLLERNSFSNTLLAMQKNQSNMEELDFDINYSVSNKPGDQQKQLEHQQRQPAKKQRNNSMGHALFKDDENLFEEDEDISIDSEFNYGDANGETFMNEMSNDASSVNFFSKNSNQNGFNQNYTNQGVRFLLENPLRFSKTMPIEQNAFKTDLNNNQTSAAKNDMTGGVSDLSKFANQNSVNSSHSPNTLAGYAFIVYLIL
jgi:hypothetical protein